VLAKIEDGVRAREALHARRDKHNGQGRAPRPSVLPRFPGFMLQGAKLVHAGRLPWD
jgi:hypothetical protein